LASEPERQSWRPVTLVGRFERDLIANLRGTRLRRARRQFQCPASPKYDRRQPPRLQLSIDLNDSVAAPDKHDVDREAHEEHVHPHERRESAVLEDHPRSGLESVAAEQAAALAAETAGAFESLAEHGSAGLIHGTYGRLRVGGLGLSHHLIM